jgi:hypothetical protein
VRALRLLFALVPGAPAIAHGRIAGGALLLLVGLAGWDLAVFGAYLLDGRWAEPARVGGISLGLAATLLSLLWTARLTSPRRRARLDRETGRALAQAQGAWLRGDLDGARVAVREGLRADSRDIDLLFLEFQLARARGDLRCARRSRRRLRRFDLDEKWWWDVEREEAVGGRG